MAVLKKLIDLKFWLSFNYKINRIEFLFRFIINLLFAVFAQTVIEFLDFKDPKQLVLLQIYVLMTGLIGLTFIISIRQRMNDAGLTKLWHLILILVPPVLIGLCFFLKTKED